MAVALMFRILLIAFLTRCRCEPTNVFHPKSSSQFGELLKPPPPPLAKILPVPFHGGASRSQRQNVDVGYVYQPPPPPPPPPLPLSQNIKFPAPFYKQYNFNFVPAPQPFTTTPSPSLFQKVSGWLFPSQQTSYDPPVYNSNSIAPVKKDCNPCNLVPWIPVIRYNLGAKNVQHQTLFSTYGPPSPTAYAPNFINQFRPQSLEHKPQQLTPGVPHAVYGPPPQTNSFEIPSSTYGPPSPTHTIAVASQNPPRSTYDSPNNFNGSPSSSYGVPSSTIAQPSSSYGTPSSTYGIPSSSYGNPGSNYGVPSSTYGTPALMFATPSPTYETAHTVTSTYSPISPNYEPSLINKDLPPQNDIDVFNEPPNELQLPKVTHPSGFRNSYGKPITNTYSIDISYPGSATAAESNKVKTEILPSDGKKLATPNMSLALANPAPFSRGRNIHTLQPVALPNLSVSPLPPIFNARPFRPITGEAFSKSVVQGINLMQQNTNTVNIEHSVPVAEFTQSVDYPPTVIKSTLIDIGETKLSNLNKTYRNIPNSFIVDHVHDISLQASEEKTAATKSNPDASFESTGAEYGNDLYDNGLPSDLRQNYKVPSNHKSGFADLRGIKDEDVDKYRTESNLQNIDSPLLYLKPSAPHKDFENFVLAVSTLRNNNEYELYDEVPTTIAPQISTAPSAWEESRNDYSESLLPPLENQNEEKPKIVQIIVPYTTGQNGIRNNIDYSQFAESWTQAPEDEYQPRKIPSPTEHSFLSTVTESYTTVSPTTEVSSPSATEVYDSERLNTHAILNDLYDVKEPPFDIIKLQHTIDDWTEQEFSKNYKTSDKRFNAKYAKQIPDDFLTTIRPFINYMTAATNYDFYDHEGSSSVKHSFIDDRNRTFSKSLKEYNTIERTKAKHNSAKNEDQEENKKPYIYTAASSFRSTTTTPAPWGKIQTSISPLTKEKVYVVTAKPWREASTVSDKPNEWYNVNFESKKTNLDNDVTASDSLPFRSPRFPHRPSFGFTGIGSGKTESLKSDSSFAFSRSWHRSINELEMTQNSTMTAPGGPDLELNISTNSYTEETNVPNTEEDTTTTTIITTTTAETPEKEGT